VNNRRTQYEIYWEILTYCKKPRSITQIIQRCNLNSKIGPEYIDFLILKGYLAKTMENDRVMFTTTTAAKGFMEIFMKLYVELFKNSPEFKL
jgi:predicted transcriptional regulator